MEEGYLRPDFVTLEQGASMPSARSMPSVTRWPR
nr:hypothetical protein [Aeromonas caviae]